MVDKIHTCKIPFDWNDLDRPEGCKGTDWFDPNDHVELTVVGDTLLRIDMDPDDGVDSPDYTAARGEEVIKPNESGGFSHFSVPTSDSSYTFGAGQDGRFLNFFDSMLHCASRTCDEDFVAALNSFREAKFTGGMTVDELKGVGQSVKQVAEKCYPEKIGSGQQEISFKALHGNYGVVSEVVAWGTPDDAIMYLSVFTDPRTVNFYGIRTDGRVYEIKAHDRWEFEAEIVTDERVGRILKTLRQYVPHDWAASLLTASEITIIRQLKRRLSQNPAIK